LLEALAEINPFNNAIASVIIPLCLPEMSNYMQLMLQACQTDDRAAIEPRALSHLSAESRNKLLFQAAKHGSYNVLNELLQHDANVNAADAHGNNVLDVLLHKEEDFFPLRTSRYPCYQAILTLLSALDCSLIDRTLYDAANFERVYAVVLREGADQHVLGSCFPLENILQRVILDIVRQVMHNLHQSPNAMMLDDAAERSELDSLTALAKVVITNGAEVNTRLAPGIMNAFHMVSEEDEEISTRATGFTILHAGAQCGSVAFVQWLLQNGADLNIRLDGSGLTPLMLASCSGFIDIVKLLLDQSLLEENEATLSLSSYTGATILHAAALWGRPQVFRTILQEQLKAQAHILRHNGYGSESAYSQASCQALAACFQARTLPSAEEKGVEALHHSRTPLLVAAAAGNLDCVLALLTVHDDSASLVTDSMDSVTQHRKEAWRAGLLQDIDAERSNVLHILASSFTCGEDGANVCLLDQLLNILPADLLGLLVAATNDVGRVLTYSLHCSSSCYNISLACRRVCCLGHWQHLVETQILLPQS
jgi:ankyrin repeat protein